MTALGAASEIRTRLRARACQRTEGVNTRSARPRGPRGDSGMTGPSGRTVGSEEGVRLGPLAEGVGLKSNILRPRRWPTLQTQTMPWCPGSKLPDRQAAFLLPL